MRTEPPHHTDHQTAMTLKSRAVIYGTSTSRYRSSNGEAMSEIRQLERPDVLVECIFGRAKFYHHEPG